MTKKYAYEMGIDCGTNGPNITNCHSAIFSSPQYTREWERGKRNAEKKKKKKMNVTKRIGRED